MRCFQFSSSTSIVSTYSLHRLLFTTCWYFFITSMLQRFITSLWLIIDDDYFYFYFLYIILFTACRYVCTSMLERFVTLSLLVIDELYCSIIPISYHSIVLRNIYIIMDSIKDFKLIVKLTYRLTVLFWLVIVWIYSGRTTSCTSCVETKIRSRIYQPKSWCRW